MGTGRFVNYQSTVQANLRNIAGYTEDGHIFLGVDYRTLNPPAPDRGSVRLTSNKIYTQGLFLAGIQHMPVSICGVWPAFQTFGPSWPSSGEIDIIKGVNQISNDTITLHTSPGLTVQNTSAFSSSNLTNPDCGRGNSDGGCPTTTSSTQGYGDGFNAIGGGVYAMKWGSEAIKFSSFHETSSRRTSLQPTKRAVPTLHPGEHQPHRFPDQAAIPTSTSRTTTSFPIPHFEASWRA